MRNPTEREVKHLPLFYAIATVCIIFSVTAYYCLKPNTLSTREWRPKELQHIIPVDALNKPVNITLSIDHAVDLLKRLTQMPHYGLPPSLPNSKFLYGFNREKLGYILNYWRNTYIPRSHLRETYMNQFPIFDIIIQGLKIRFVHVRSRIRKQTKPVLLLHTWPTTFLEFYEFIPLLLKPPDAETLAFDVVAPCLPGFGWSDGALYKGLGPFEMAILLQNLMIQLNYREFLVHGGGWGGVIATNIAKIFPNNVIALHSTSCYTTYSESLINDLDDTGSPIITLDEPDTFYFPIIRSDTIGTALQNNPVGMAAFMMEKFLLWTNYQNVYKNDGNFDIHINENYDYLDRLLDQVTVYWITKSMTTSLRLFTEAFTDIQKSHQKNVHAVADTVMVGCPRYTDDYMEFSKVAIKSLYSNIPFQEVYEGTGNFIAMTRPELLYKDFIKLAKRAIADLKS